jgi:hypothetical protein
MQQRCHTHAHHHHTHAQDHCQARRQGRSNPVGPDASAGTAREVGSGGQTDGRTARTEFGFERPLLRWATPMLTMGASAFCKRLALSKINRSHGISHLSPASTGLQLRRTPHSFARLGRPSGHAKSGVNTSKPTPIWASNEVSTSFSAHQGPRPSGHGFISLLSKQKPLLY